MKGTGRRKWRHQLQPGQPQRLRKILTAALVFECLYGSRQLLPMPVIPQLVTTQQMRQVEWVVPGADDNAAESDVYGFRFFREDGSLQFYHIRETINGH